MIRLVFSRFGVHWALPSSHHSCGAPGHTPGERPDLAGHAMGASRADEHGLVGLIQDGPEQP